MGDDRRNAKLPPGWGDDPLSSFLHDAQSNTFATFHNLPVHFQQLVAFDSLFRDSIPHFGSSRDWLLGVFLLRCHACYLAAVRLATSGQLPEMYLLLRSCLETSLYAHHIEGDPEPRSAVWVNRNDNDESRRACRSEFSTRRVLSTLEDRDVKLHKAVQALYDRTIDRGAHPNPGAFLPAMSIQSDPSTITIEIRYMSGPGLALESALKSLSQTTLACLSVFELSAPQKFALLGISDKLKELRSGL